MPLVQTKLTMLKERITETTTTTTKVTEKFVELNPPPVGVPAALATRVETEEATPLEEDEEAPVAPASNFGMSTVSLLGKRPLQEGADPPPNETRKERGNRLQRERRARKNMAAPFVTRLPSLVAKPCEHVDFYSSQLRNAGKKDGAEILGKAPGLCEANDGRVYKESRGGEVVVYVHAHGISYTLADIEAGSLKYERFQKIEMFGMGEKDRLHILDPVTGKTMPKPPDGAPHSLHIFLSAPHKYDPTGKFRLDKTKSFDFVLGNGKGVNMPDACKERDFAVAEAVAHAKTLPNKKKCCSCGSEDLENFSFQFHKRDKRYILQGKCIDCRNECENARRATAVKTESGKAESLARNAIQHQNVRRDIHPHLDLPLLDMAKVKPVLALVFLSMMSPFLSLPRCIALGVKTYNVSLDKLDDDLKYYIGFRFCDGVRVIDLTNLSFTLNINNGRSNPTVAAKDALLERFRKGEAASVPNPLQIFLDMAAELKSQIEMGDQARYTCDYHSEAAYHIKQIASDMKNNQNKRRKIKGREHMNELTDADLPKLREFLLDLLVAQKFCCAYSSILLCPARLHGFQMSPERLDDSKGYDEPGNVVLVFHLFQAKLNSTQRNDEDGNDEFVNIEWSRKRFFEIGEDVFDDKIRFKFTDLPIEEQRKHEAAILAAIGPLQ